MTQLPSSLLAENADVIRGVTFSKGDAIAEPRDGYIPVLRAGNIQGHLILDRDLMYVPKQMVSERQMLRRGDILMCTSSGSAEIVGKTAYFDQDWSGTAGAFCAVIRAQPEKCTPRYLYHFLQTPAFRNWTRNSSGIGIKNIRKSELDSYEVRFPDLGEQHRVAKILDQADVIRRTREEMFEIAQSFPQALLYDMFGDLVDNAKNWITRSLGSLLVVSPQNGLYRPSTDYGNGIRILRIDGFYDGYLMPQAGFKRLRLEPEIAERYRLNEGDVVINRVNSRKYLGKSALIEGLLEPTVFESNMMRFRIDPEQVSERFFVDQLQTQFIKRQILTRAKDAVNQSSINQGDVESLDIRLPPIALQRKYTAVVQRIQSSRLASPDGREQATEFSAALSNRAFRGEL